jgi:membrane protease YdiL (CAAX protease family)
LVDRVRCAEADLARHDPGISVAIMAEAPDDGASDRLSTARPSGVRGSDRGTGKDAALRLVGRRKLAFEVWVVLGLSLGASAVYALLDLVQSLGARAPLHAQSAVINSAAVPNRSLLDLTYQLVGIAVALMPVVLVGYLMNRSGESVGSLGLDASHPLTEIAWGAALAAGVGGIGLAFYIGAYHAGFNLDVVPTNLPPSWWRIPVLVVAAFQDGILEEVVVCGYLLHRLRQLGWSDNKALATSAVLRGGYHLYQGFGGFVANAAMGLLFGRLYQRQGRLGRLILAHSLIDTGAFVGYVLLKGHVSWLP